jgi:hypothetical protein
MGEQKIVQSEILLHVYQIWIKCVKSYKDNERKLKISFVFSKFNRDNSVKNQHTISKFYLDLCINSFDKHTHAIWTL